MEKWRQSLIPVINEIREELKKVPLPILAERSGVEFEEKGPDSRENKLKVKFFGKVYSISYPQFIVTNPIGQECKEELKALLLHYLRDADGTPISDEWISFRELPNGSFYHHAFQGYSGDRLPREFENQLGKFAQACINLGGDRLSFGDQSFCFQVLPRVKLAVVYWCGGEEFPDRANVLFDGSAGRYLPTDGLAQLGRILTDRIIQVKEDIDNEDSDNR